jgi:hypothetical protein
MKAILVLSAAVAVWAADKPLPTGQAEDKYVRLEVTAYLDKESARKAVGGELEEGFVVFDVKLTPREGQKLTIIRDDFLIRSDKDGQRGQPYTPSQIAGSSVMIVRTGYEGGSVMREDRGPAWGGLGGGAPGRMPGGLPGSPSSVGNTGSEEKAVASVAGNPTEKAANPLLANLEAKILPEKELDGPVSGQLYFLLEGKHKTKQVELLYKTPAGRLSVRFK